MFPYINSILTIWYIKFKRLTSNRIYPEANRVLAISQVIPAGLEMFHWRLVHFANQKKQIESELSLE